MTAPILVIGRSGQVARELRRAAEATGTPLVAAGRDELDLLATLEVRPLLDRVAPSAVVNAAAYTAVERAELEPGPAFRLNRDAPGALARACAERGVPFVHFSTDYVFDGRKGAPYVETDARAPLNVYGRSKAEGEDAVDAAGGRAVTLRTSWVYSAAGTNFVTTMLRLAREREVVRVVDDQLGRPTWAADCAEAALRVARAHDAVPGVLHLTGGGEATWAEFARAVFAGSGERGGPTAVVEPVSSAQFGARAARPLDGRLDDTELRRRLGWGPAPWPAALPRCLDEVFSAPAAAG